jgi:hypothetical protein
VEKTSLPSGYPVSLDYKILVFSLRLSGFLPKLVSTDEDLSIVDSNMCGISLLRRRGRANRYAGL